MNGKANQGPLFDINVWCHRSVKTKLHPMIVRQYIATLIQRKHRTQTGLNSTSKSVFYFKDRL